MTGRQVSRWQEEGEDPDYRFSLANERTFLAWIRTALAILAGAILLHQIQTSIQPIKFSALASGAVAALSAMLSAGAYFRWRANEVAMRHGRSLPRSRLVPFLSAGVALLGVAAAVGLWMQRSP